MLIAKPGQKIKVHMVQTPQGPRPRFNRGTDRLAKDKKNSLGMHDGEVTVVTEQMFLVKVGDKEHTISTSDIDLRGFLED